jgi:hypothetical protein
MTRYFFCVSYSDTYEDEVGYRFSGNVDAKAHAELMAKELAEDDSNWKGYSVIVTDENGAEIARVPVSVTQH